MIIKKTITSKDFGALSKQAQILFSRVAERLHPKFGQGVISSDAAKFMNFSDWMTSTGLSDDLKRYQLPLPLGVQHSYPDYEGLQATKQSNKVIDEVLASVVREMNHKELDQVSFATEGSSDQQSSGETGENDAWSTKSQEELFKKLEGNLDEIPNEKIAELDKKLSDVGKNEKLPQVARDLANKGSELLDNSKNTAWNLTKRMLPKKNESLSDMWNRWDDSQKVGAVAGIGATTLGLGHWLTKKKKDAVDHAVGVASIAAPVLGAVAGSWASDKYDPNTYDKSYIAEQMKDYFTTLNSNKG